MCPLFTVDVSPLYVPVQVNTFVIVSSVAVTVPLPFGALPFGPLAKPGGSFEGFSAAAKFSSLGTTVMVTLLVFVGSNEDAATMLLVPSLTAVTVALLPLAATVATAVFDDVHVTAPAAPLVTATFAVSVAVRLTAMDPVGAPVIDTDVTVPGGVESPPHAAAAITAAHTSIVPRCCIGGFLGGVAVRTSPERRSRGHLISKGIPRRHTWFR